MDFTKSRIADAQMKDFAILNYSTSIPKFLSYETAEQMTKKLRSCILLWVHRDFILAIPELQSVLKKKTCVLSVVCNILYFLINF